MITAPINPASVTLEVTWQTFEGSEKLNITSASVTVFHRDAAGNRVVDLASTPMTQDAGTGTWKLAWVSPALPNPGQFIVEYHATDTDGVVGVEREDMTVLDTDADLGTVLDCLLGRQKVDATTYKYTIYRRNGQVLAVFDLKDDAGNPSVADIFDRQPE
jgi:hypothetical protein